MLRALLDASTALSFEQERLLDGGVSLISALDPSFPTGLRERLGAACPPFLLAGGPIDWLARPGLAVVGSRDGGDPALDVARRAAELAVEHAWSVISGLARGVDQAAMAGGYDAGGVVIGVGPRSQPIRVHRVRVASVGVGVGRRVVDTRCGSRTTASDQQRTGRPPEGCSSASYSRAAIPPS